MTPRAVCMMAIFALLANAAIGLWLAAEIHFWKSLKPVTFESVSSTGTHISAAFGHGHVDIDLAWFGRDGKAEFHSLQMHY